MKDEIKSIIDKYTGKTIDDIPDSFIDGQTLEIRQLIRFIQNSTIIENNCEIHTNFTGKLCPVCLMNELRQTQARLNHADKEIERIKEENDKYRRAMQENCELRRIAESFREQRSFQMKIKLTPYKINGEYIVLDIYPTTKEKNQLLNNIKNNCLFSVEEISEKSAVNLSWPWPNPDLKGE